MVKVRRTTIENNHKVTDFFTQQPSSSFRPPPSSAPAPSSTAKHMGAKQSSEARKPALSQTQPSSQTQLKLGSGQISQIRTMKKENAPPPARTRAPSITIVSSSSDAPTRISISSTSVLSLDSSVVEVVPPVRQDRRLLQTIDVASSSSFPSQRRRSPRVQVPKDQSNRGGFNNVAPRPRKPAPKKRKKPDGVQSDDGDVMDLDAMEEVIYVSTKPARINLVTPEPSVGSRPASSRKRPCVNASQQPDTSSDVVEVIPSSQSDEQELSIPRKEKKDIEEIKENVREWQLSSSQSNVPPESSDSPCQFDADFGDQGMDIDLDRPSSPVVRDVPKTPTSARRTSNFSSQSTPRKDSRLMAPVTPSSPRKLPPSAVPESIRYPSGSKSPSPMLVSSASSLTRVDTPVYVLSSRNTGTPRSTPNGKLKAKIDSSRKHSPHTGSNIAESGIDIDLPILTQNEKTDAIIKQIRAEAHAKAMAMPDEDSMVLGSLNDSDSELGSPTNLFRLARDKRPGQTANQPSTSKATTEAAIDDGDDLSLMDVDELDGQPDRRRSTHQQSRRSLSPTCLSSVAQRTRKAPNMLPTVLTSAARAPPKKSVNPLAKLLKEKARQERFAEIRKNPNLDSDVNLSDAAEEEFAEWRSPSCSQLRRQISDDGDMEKVVGEVDRRRLFGEEDNTVLGKILESDRRDKGKGKALITEVGVPLWEPSGETMETDAYAGGLPCLETTTKEQSVALLREFIHAEDVDGIVMLLQSGVFIIRDSGFVQWLFEAAVFSIRSLAVTAHTVLCHICESRPRNEQDLIVSISPVQKALSKFGARQDVLQAFRLEVVSDNRLPLNDTQRSEALWRLSELVRAFASRAMLAGDDVPSYFAILLAIGMDPTSNFNLRLSIKRALNELISCYCGGFSDGRSETERNVCLSVSNLTSNLSPANKEYLLAFIDGDNPVSRRIAQWIAFVMLTGGYGTRLAKESLAGPPSLDDIIALLNPRLDSKLRSDLFNVSRNSEQSDSFDYAHLTHHVEVLGRVLMNIPQYALIEKQEASARKSEVFSRGIKETSKLQIIKDLLDRLGNNIADTRAAHLDRSHAKAVILQLAVRIHYQRKVGIEKPRTENFFKPKLT